MYEYLTGTISIVAPQYIVVDVQGVGYKLLVANPYRFHEDSAKAVRVFVYQAVRDDVYAADQRFGNWPEECFGNSGQP